MLGEKLKLRCGAEIKNRIAKAAMSEALADSGNNPGDDYIRLFERWGKGGAGMLITGNIQIDRRHLEHVKNLALDENTDIEQMKTFAAAAKAGGARVLAQLSHSGRQTPLALNPTPLSISDVALSVPGHGAPRAASEKELLGVVGQFSRAAALAKEAGFDGAEIHAAHGWLLSSSLSPLVNNRADRWGGSLENRARLLLSVVRAVRAETGGSFVVAVKLNSSDFQKGGFDREDSAATARMLEEEGVDFVEISGGNYESPAAYQHKSAASPRELSREAFFLEYARDIKAALQIPVMVTGGFRSAAAMRDAVAGGGADIVGAARPFIMDPSFPEKMLRGEIESAPAAERDFPPADQLPRTAVLNWFCHQLKLLAETGAPDRSIPVEEGHRRYLAEMESAFAQFAKRD